MAPLVLLALLIGGVLYLAGALYYLYRYLVLSSSYPQMPRVWFDLRRRFVWLAAIGLACLAGFAAVGWWSMSGHGIPWLPDLFGQGDGMTPAAQAPAPQRNVSPEEKMVRQRVPEPESTTMATTTQPTETSSTTSTTTSTESSSTTTSTTTAPPPAKTRAAKTLRPSAGWTICAASFRKLADARRYAQKLEKQGMEVRLVKADLGAKGVWHRVCVGTFANLEQAKKQSRVWEKQGLISDPFLLPQR